ncbi:hypothetical protein BsIDN1_43850 [Bacillus safensis]|uniref:Helicase C-terminal domain-containing protein n=1 Tax=Bacillus safensis TaxID=561879 RepID=A0A5S9MB80_BACIA|nr:hypothetical protein BsIDN1_43850 [Bacillus safensis]
MINYELPSDLDFYVHRVGRTARAGSSGIAMTIYELADEDALIQIEKMGVVFENKTIVHGEWRDADDRLKRQRRKKPRMKLKKKAKRLVRKKPKAVKPGYKKKKMTREMDKIKRQERRKSKRNGK